MNKAKTHTSNSLKTLLLLAGVLGVLFSGYGQGGFSKLYLEGSGTSCVLYDHPYILTAAQTSDSTGKSGISFIKTDLAGNVITTQDFYLDSTDIYPGFQNALIKTGTDQYVMAGYIIPNSFLLKLNGNLQVTDTVIYDLEPSAAITLTQADNKDFLVSGVVFKEDSTTQEFRKGFLCARYDEQFNLKWSRSFHSLAVNGKTVEQQAQNIIEDSQGNIWMGGYRQKWNTDNSADMLIMGLDSSGNKFFEQTYGDTALSEIIASIIETPDSNYLVAGGLGISPVNISGLEVSYIKIRVFEMDINGNILWDKTYAEPYAMNYPVTISKSGNNYIVGGHYYVWPLDSNDNRESAFKSYALKIKPNGDSVWYREYSLGHLFWDYNRFYDIQSTSDGGFVAGGHFSSDISPLTSQPGSHVWIVRADSFGCVVQGCQNISIAEEGSVSRISLYPNPTHGTFQLEGLQGIEAELKIYNSSGQEVLYQARVQEQQAIALPHQPAGLYLVQVLQKAKVLYSTKLLLQP